MSEEALETGLVLPGVVVPVGFGEVRVRVVGVGKAEMIQPADGKAI